jgi:hypothetical protein
MNRADERLKTGTRFLRRVNWSAIGRRLVIAKIAGSLPLVTIALLSPPIARSEDLSNQATPARTTVAPNPSPESRSGQKAEEAPKVAAPSRSKAKGKAKPKGKTRAAQAKARQRNAIQAAARTASQPVLPPRPGRVVTPPTLTSPELDQLIQTYLKTESPDIAPAPQTNDIEFVRRIYFDVIGQPPTAEQVEMFVSGKGPNKRSRLIDQLLDSPEYARNWARYWRDVIKYHATGQNPVRVNYPGLESWLAERFEANEPWDAIASGLITAAGRNDENGAVGFALAHDAKPVEMAGEVSRIFMGIQIQCAQCHDHKTDSWRQRQFHEFAAFFAGGRQRNYVKAGMGRVPVFGVIVQGKPRYSMPDNNDPKATIPVSPRFFLDSSGPSAELPQQLDAVSRRELVASYVTGQDNPWFSRAYVNRIWYALMGETFYETIDDIGPERTARAPELLDTVATQWQRGGYDVRWLFRLILNTKAYQRRVRSTANPAGLTAFASNCPSRLRSDQVFEGLARALGLPLDESGNLVLPNRAAAGKARGVAGPKKVAEAAGLGGIAANRKIVNLRQGGPRGLFVSLFGADPSQLNEDILGTIPQALYLMNSPLVHQRTQARPGTVLGKILADSPNDRSALNALYLRVLSRPPTQQEVRECSDYLAQVGNREESFEDIYWCLVNSTEFLTRR